MTNRREFLKDVAGAAGLVFVGCGIADAAQARPAGASSTTPRRPVVIKGRRITTVDMHAHCAVPKATELLRRPAANQGTDDPLMLDGQALAQRLAVMERSGSTSQFSASTELADVSRDLATDVIRVRTKAGGVLREPFDVARVRLGGAAVSDLAAQQLEHGMKTLGLRGVAIGGSVAGKELADPSFHPFWAKAEALGAVVFIHPQPAATPNLGNRLRGNGLLTNVIGNPLETTIALSHLIFEGTLDQFPGLKICAAPEAVTCRRYESFRSWLRDVSGAVQGRCSEGTSDNVCVTDVLRFAGVHAGGAASSRRGGRRGQDRHGHRLSVSVGRGAGRSCAGDARAGRRGAPGDPRADRGAVAGPDRQVVDRIRSLAGRLSGLCPLPSALLK